MADKNTKKFYEQEAKKLYENWKKNGEYAAVMKIKVSPNMSEKELIKLREKLQDYDFYEYYEGNFDLLFGNSQVFQKIPLLLEKEVASILKEYEKKMVKDEDDIARHLYEEWEKCDKFLDEIEKKKKEGGKKKGMSSCTNEEVKEKAEFMAYKIVSKIFGK